MREVFVVVGVGDFGDAGGGGNFKEFVFEVAHPFVGAGAEDAADSPVALAFGGDGDLTGEGAVFTDGGVGGDTDVVVFGSGEGGVGEVGALGEADEVALLLLGA